MSSIAHHVDRMGPAICQLTVSDKDGRQHTGTGFATEPLGRVITCNHVAQPTSGSYSIRARFPDGQEFDATLIWHDSQKDLAILQLSGRAPSSVELAIRPVVRVGDDIFVAGYPTGVRTMSIFKGCVSAKDSGLRRSVDTELLQLAVTVQKGNSGGPVVSADTGDVLGVVTMKYVPLFAELDKLRQIANNWPTLSGSGGHSYGQFWLARFQQVFRHNWKRH